MNRIKGYLELGELNSEIMESYLRDSARVIAVALENLDECTRLLKEYEKTLTILSNIQYPENEGLFSIN